MTQSKLIVTFIMVFACVPTSARAQLPGFPGIDAIIVRPMPQLRTVEIARPPVAAAIVTSPDAAIALPPANPTVRIPTGELAVLQTASASIRVGPSPAGLPADASNRNTDPRERIHWNIPLQYTFVPSPGTTRTSRLVAEDAGGMRLGPKNVFQARLLLRLLDVEDVQAAYDLPQPAEVIVTSSAVDRIDPQRLSLTKTATWYEVRLEADAPQGDIEARILSSALKDGLSMTVPLRRPIMTITPTSPELEGFGLEASTVTVNVSGLPSPLGHEVTLSISGKGRIDPPVIKLDANGRGTATVRSSGAGKLVVVGTSSLVSPGESRPVDVTQPWLFGGFSLGGAGLGAVLAWLRKARAASGWRVALIALTSGVLAALAGAVGINLVGTPLPSVTNQIGVAVLAALGAAWGVPSHGPQASARAAKPSS